MTTLLTLRKHTLIALAVLGMGAATLPAQAQQASQPAAMAATAGEHGAQYAKHGKHAGQKMTPEQRRAKWAARAAARQQKLQDALALTLAQQGAWANYQAALKPQPRAQKLDRAARAALPAPQRMEQRLQMAKQRIAAMEARLAATNTFYSVLSADQKKAFDAAATGQGRRGHGHGGHRMHRMQADSGKPVRS